jgi:hypothetical protein
VGNAFASSKKPSALADGVVTGAERISDLPVAVNVGKIMFAGFVGILSGGTFVAVGLEIIKQRGR